MQLKKRRNRCRRTCEHRAINAKARASTAGFRYARFIVRFVVIDVSAVQVKHIFRDALLLHLSSVELYALSKHYYNYNGI